MEQLTIDGDAIPIREVKGDLKSKVEESLKIMRLAADMSLDFYKEPIVICYSGGKDSDCLLHIAETCLKPNEYEVLHSHTTVDAPETVYHIRKQFDRLKEKGVKATIDYHEYIDQDGNKKRVTMWNLIPQRGIAPTRLARYCCSQLKESGTPNRLAALGVRGGESVKRQGRDVFGVRGGSYREATFFSLDHTAEVYEESKTRDAVWDCKLIEIMRKNGDTVVNPIYDWTDRDVWEYIRQEGIETNPLYEKGYSRIGCIGCPMGSYKQKLKEFSDYPTYKRAYIRAFDKMVEKLKAKQKKDGAKRELEWNNGQDVFDWWVQEDKYGAIKGQQTIGADLTEKGATNNDETKADRL